MNQGGENRPETQKTCAVEPSTAMAYLDPHYWDERFAREEHYEWFKDYSHFRHLIQQHVKPNSSVLELGCGNSQLCEGLYRDGITDITCIDLSAVAVEKMQKRLLSKGYREIKVLEADMLDLPFTNECFDLVIEKGTMVELQSFMVLYYSLIATYGASGDPWNPRSETVNNVITMLRGVHQALKRDGIFISIAFGQPHFRRPFFNDPEFTWSVEWNTFGKEFHYFFYILKKGCRSSENNDGERVAVKSLSLFHDELEAEDYIFRTNIHEDDG